MTFIQEQHIKPCLQSLPKFIFIMHVYVTHLTISKISLWLVQFGTGMCFPHVVPGFNPLLVFMCLAPPEHQAIEIA